MDTDSVEKIEMMQKSNYIALVYTKDKKKVVVWDDYEERACTEIAFHTDVLQMKLI